MNSILGATMGTLTYSRAERKSETQMATNTNQKRSPLGAAEGRFLEGFEGLALSSVSDFMLESESFAMRQMGEGGD